MLHILSLSWNGADMLSRLKNSLDKSLEGLDYIWHIRDNGSTDDTVDTVENKWENKDRVNFIKYKNNLQNFSEGVNNLFDIAKPDDNDLVLLLNNDVIFNDNKSIQRMIDLLKGDVGVVGAKLLYTNTNKLQHAGVVFTPSYKLPVNYRSGQKDDDKASANRYYQAVTGAVMLMKAGTYKEAGCLDNNYIFSFEDIDLCLHILYNMKQKILYCGETNIFHDESASLKKNSLNRLFLSRNANYFLSKWKNRYKVDIEDYNKNKNFQLHNA